MFGSNCNTASVPLVANIDGNGNNNGWGAEGSWLWFIIVIFAIFGWGGFGNGFGGNGMNGGVGSEIQRGFDNQAVVSKLGSAVVEPMGMSKISNFLNQISKLMFYLVGILLAVSFMYVLTLGLIMCLANGF